MQPARARVPVLAGAEADGVALGEQGLWLHLVCSLSGMLGFRELPSPWILSSPGPQPPAAFHLGPEDPSKVLVLAKQTRHALRHRPSLLDSLFSQDTRKPPTSAIGRRGLHAGADGYGGTVCHAQDGNPQAHGRGLARALTPCTCAACLC